mmetsp:Transcript_40780/g.59603  ORF Transcript_40780/g.59603 Transcript_40780/m.59603 type:complete len:197 (-) Transcript_40780:48-638(-)
MAVVGGGFMSDYDVYPLHKQVSKGLPLPNGGKFTNYDPNPSSGVPSFQSGNAEEWDRMVNELMKYVPLHKGEFYSDMFALRDFNLENPGTFGRCPKIIGHTHLMVTEDGHIDCEKYVGLIGFHLSHESAAQTLEKGFFREVEGAKSRAVYAKRFINKFRKECVHYGEEVHYSLAHIYWQSLFPFDNDVQIHESLMS